MSLTPLIERFYHEVWNQQDEAVAREILHPAFKFRASLGPLREGPDGFIDYMRSIHTALADYVCIIEEIVDTGPTAAAKMLFRGTHQADFFGVAATGKEITWAGAAFFKTDGTQITELWVLGDVDAVKNQLDAGPKTAF